jgi:prepilin signal peptidase PulO-like enzyme (type II secretory pathway)
MSIRPRIVALLALGALAPAVAYVLTDPIAAVTLLNIVLITGCLWVALSPHETGDASGHGDGAIDEAL